MCTYKKIYMHIYIFIYTYTWMLPLVHFAIVALSTRAQFYSDVGGAS